MASLDITARDSITDAVHKTQALRFGGTDCDLRMLDALNRGVPVGCFMVDTDSETCVGSNSTTGRAAEVPRGDGPARQASGGHGNQRVQRRRARGRRDAGRSGPRRRRAAV